MTQEELNKVLRLHKQWLESDCMKGKRADLHGAYMRDANLKDADLHAADLHGANLHAADLHGANLHRADLSGANLHRADLSGANLYPADLSGANLNGANLQGAYMGDANLQGAYMRDANLQGAYMRDANLQGAYLSGANLNGANLDCSAWPLWCGSFDVKCDIRLASQLAYHFCRLECEDKEVVAAQNALITLANKFHRVVECGVLKPKQTTKLSNSKKQGRKGKVNK